MKTQRWERFPRFEQFRRRLGEQKESRSGLLNPEVSGMPSEGGEVQNSCWELSEPDATQIINYFASNVTLQSVYAYLRRKSQDYLPVTQIGVTRPSVRREEAQSDQRNRRSQSAVILSWWLEQAASAGSKASIWITSAIH
ncbi:hypothetical protein K0M31_012979 [Melipona bicolor]|uniref:Uncharacterized protein n=1 Tax=Melipona bicolor TaxID=60889 RepID=A0AA40KGZ7_9HYME|nr:hypothetical protein K0M31_012979 [Melipona bicolor]